VVIGGLVVCRSRDGMSRMRRTFLVESEAMVSVMVVWMEARVGDVSVGVDIACCEAISTGTDCGRWGEVLV